jgi:hypothetical protein
MKEARSQISELLNLNGLEGSSLEILTIEKNFRDVLSSQLGFCKRSIPELNDYFIKEIEGEIDTKKIKKSCLLSLRKWNINVEKKLFKLKRLEIKKRVEKSLDRLNQIEINSLKELVKKYNDLI